MTTNEDKEHEFICPKCGHKLYYKEGEDRSSALPCPYCKMTITYILEEGGAEQTASSDGWTGENLDVPDNIKFPINSS